MRRLLSITALLAAASAVPAFAQFTLSLGLQSTQIDIETESTRHLVGGDLGILNLEDAADDQATDWGGELALGYQYNFNPTLNMALEAFGQLAKAKVQVPVNSSFSDFLAAQGIPFYDATASFDWIAGLRLRPGYYITSSTRFFIDGGIVWGDFQLKQAHHIVSFYNMIPDAAFSETERETLFGWRYGAGVEHKVTEDFAIGVDLTFTEFEEFNSDTIEDLAEHIREVSDGNAQLAAKSTYTPTLTTIGLNFKYLF